ncbi:hypothetical protein JZO70_08415 [Enterococcus sp. 669A]|uniref:Uncharacterized protein n=1 Tax=Candidatus Enterococcus moelleringii TaxID=2815325 RepID=A0ABS3LBR2_9ENTE|nr:hypothetical protein [Enterococcus sp. 669A]MBO1306181.1 hypothetical protein [Enterococcus sp. 669A]
MKSSDTQLKARGFLDQEDLISFQSCSFEQLLELLDAKDPVARSGAARLLPLTNETTKKLLQTVQQEKKLYCRLEMMRKLESGDCETARMMLPYLGKIGRNQHTIPLTKPSGKKSFPLPRDLIARSLGNMSPEILPILFEQLDVLPEAELSELIDAIGQLLFYHPEAVQEEHFEQLEQVWEQTESPLIQWKLVVCFSALPQSRNLLETIAASMPALTAEAQRSLTILSQRRIYK